MPDWQKRMLQYLHLVTNLLSIALAIVAMEEKKRQGTIEELEERINLQLSPLVSILIEPRFLDHHTLNTEKKGVTERSTL
jgi:hypothetical protein